MISCSATLVVTARNGAERFRRRAALSASCNCGCCGTRAGLRPNTTHKRSGAYAGSCCGGAALFRLHRTFLRHGDGE
jgi:hypothetical protein